MASRNLNDKEYAELVDMLRDLEGHIPSMRGNSGSFVRDQVDRHNKYGQSILISDRQMSWLRNLHDEFVGTRDQEPAPLNIHDRDDIDDEVPY